MNVKTIRRKIYVVDDDQSVRKALKRLLCTVASDVDTFASAQEFLKSWDPRKQACLILDIHLGGMSGLELYQHLVEILSRQRAHVLSDRIILEPEETKNSEGRFFPITTTLRMILDEQEVVTKELEKREGRIIAWLFHHNGEPLAKHYEKRGYWKPTRYFLRAWNEACKAAGLVGRLRHDFRRTAVRRFDTLPDHVGMKLSGHKSHSVYLAYKATSESDIFEAAKKLDKEKIKRGHRKAGS